MNRTIFHRIAWVLGALAVVSGYVFALHGNHPDWMMATFWFTLGTIISAALGITQP